FESWRSRKKETSRREDVAERLKELEESEKAARLGMVALEDELLRLQAKLEKTSPKNFKRVLPREVWNVKDDGEPVPPPQSWLSRLSGHFQVVKDRNIKIEPNLQNNDALKPSFASSQASKGS